MLHKKQYMKKLDLTSHASLDMRAVSLQQDFQTDRTFPDYELFFAEILKVSFYLLFHSKSFDDVFPMTALLQYRCW